VGFAPAFADTEKESDGKMALHGHTPEPKKKKRKVRQAKIFNPPPSKADKEKDQSVKVLEGRLRSGQLSLGEFTRIATGRKFKKETPRQTKGRLGAEAKAKRLEATQARAKKKREEAERRFRAGEGK